MATQTAKFQWPVSKADVYAIMVDHPLSDTSHTRKAMDHVERAEVLGDYTKDNFRYFNVVYHFSEPDNVPFLIKFLTRMFRRSLKTLAKCRWDFANDTLESRFEPFILNWCFTVTARWSLSEDDNGHTTQYWMTTATCSLPIVGKSFEKNLVKIAYQDYAKQVQENIKNYSPGPHAAVTDVTGDMPGVSRSCNYHWPLPKEDIYRIFIDYPTRNPETLMQLNPQLTGVELQLDETLGRIRRTIFLYSADLNLAPSGIVKALKPFFPKEIEWTTESWWNHETWSQRERVTPSRLSQHLKYLSSFKLISLPDNSTRMEFLVTVKCTLPMVGKQIEDFLLEQGFQAFDDKVTRMLVGLKAEQASLRNESAQGPIP